MKGKLQSLFEKMNVSSPAQEPPSKKTRGSEEKEEELEAGQLALAKYLKNDLREMIKEEVGGKIQQVEEKMKQMAIATDEGFKELEEKVKREERQRKEWQGNMDVKFGEIEKLAVEAAAKMPSHHPAWMLLRKLMTKSKSSKLKSPC